MIKFKKILESVLDEQSGAGAPKMSDTEKKNKGSVKDYSDKSVAGTDIVDEDISDAEKGTKGSITTGTKGGKFIAGKTKLETKKKK